MLKNEAIAAAALEPPTTPPVKPFVTICDIDRAVIENDRGFWLFMRVRSPWESEEDAAHAPHILPPYTFGGPLRKLK